MGELLRQLLQWVTGAESHMGTWRSVKHAHRNYIMEGSGSWGIDSLPGVKAQGDYSFLGTSNLSCLWAQLPLVAQQEARSIVMWILSGKELPTLEVRAVKGRAWQHLQQEPGVGCRVDTLH